MLRAAAAAHSGGGRRMSTDAGNRQRLSYLIFAASRHWRQAQQGCMQQKNSTGPCLGRQPRWPHTAHWPGLGALCPAARRSFSG